MHLDFRVEKRLDVVARKVLAELQICNILLDIALPLLRRLARHPPAGDRHEGLEFRVRYVNTSKHTIPTGIPSIPTFFCC